MKFHGPAFFIEDAKINSERGSRKNFRLENLFFRVNFLNFREEHCLLIKNGNARNDFG